ncbi:hypothetical protein FRC04_004675 [Tulasnella sp. 424]|nr:hypothetical protein FRC04_004675 [Tulasnella sp. 424]KAG8961726.1 hypothetical protein FRC05_005822 [Tulasnella sp. 425]
MDDLPVELLSYIFLFLYKDPSIPRAKDDFQNSHKLHSTTTVCKRWKDAIEMEPALWTDIWLGHSPAQLHRAALNKWLKYVAVQLDRSGKLPINLDIMVEFVELEDAFSVLKQHLPRCRRLDLRAARRNDGTDHPWFNKFSMVRELLHFPFPVMKFLTIDNIAYGMAETGDEDHGGMVLVDAPNLVSLTSRDPSLKTLVKYSLLPPFFHSSLTNLSICGSWGDGPFDLPPDKLSLPSLKTLRLENTDHLWQFLSALSIPHLEDFIIVCDLANWPSTEELPVNTSAMMHLRRLEWHTTPVAEREAPSLLRLFQSSPNLVSFSYITDDVEHGRFRAFLAESEQDGDVDLLAIYNMLLEQEGTRVMLCPKLRRLCLPSVSLDDMARLIELRPALEYISLQSRITGDTVVVGSREKWRTKIDQMRWIKSRVEFEFPTLRLRPGLPQEEDIAWSPE